MSSRAAVLIVVAAALAACSSDEAPATGSLSTSTTATTATVTTTTVTTAAATSTSTSTTIVSGVFADAASLAGDLSTIEAGIRAPDVTPAALADLGRRQQLAYRAVNRHPEWHAALLEQVDPVASGPLSFHLAARQALADHAAGRPPSDPPTTLPAWTIVEPLPIDELRGYYDEAETATGVPWQYLAAIHFQETRMGRVVGVSSAGAVGPMQFLPSTWARCCEGDPTVARDAILGTARYLVENGAPGDMQAALYGYNPNSGYVGAVTAYAQNMIADERAYLGYYGWEVFYGTSEGTVRLPVGYSETVPIDVVAYLRDHPQDLVPAG
jgi:hypothetical protein